MAKQVKVFAGLTNVPAVSNYGQQNITLYTVPSGRVAKIHFTRFKVPTYGYLYISGIQFYVDSNPYPAPGPGAGYMANEDIMWGGGNGIMPRQFYMAAGQSIVYQTSGTTYSDYNMEYSFSAVEEY